MHKPFNAKLTNMYCSKITRLLNTNNKIFPINKITTLIALKIKLNSPKKKSTLLKNFFYLNISS